MLTAGLHPFGSKKRNQVQNIANYKPCILETEISKSAQNLIRRMTNFDSSARPSCKQILDTLDATIFLREEHTSGENSKDVSSVPKIEPIEDASKRHRNSKWMEGRSRNIGHDTFLNSQVNFYVYENTILFEFYFRVMF